MEPRCGSYIHQLGRRLENWTISEDPPSSHVPYTSVGYSSEYFPPSLDASLIVSILVTGAIVNYGTTASCGNTDGHLLTSPLTVVMASIVTARLEILLDPIGNNVWSGQYTQTLNTNAVTWSLAKEVYGGNGPYFIVPMGLAIGMDPTFFQWLILEMAQNRTGTSGFNYFAHHLHGKSLALFYLFMPNLAGQYTAALASGVSSIVTFAILVGLASQLWLRRYHPRWYRDYNYILGGALDGGAQVMIFIL